MIPGILKTISGFNSCLTVSLTSAVFIWSIHIAILTGKSAWPNVLTAFIMMMGPIIIALNFVNAKMMINSVMHQPTAEGDEPERFTPPLPPSSLLTLAAIEREMMGVPAMILRSIAGAISAHVICFCSLLFTWTIHDALIHGKPLPSDYELLLIVIGPVITSWSFVRAGGTLDTVIKSTNVINKARDKLAGFIKPK